MLKVTEGKRYVVIQSGKPNVYLTCSYANAKQAWFKSDGCKDTDYRYTFDDGKLHHWVLVGWDNVVNGTLEDYEVVTLEYIS